MAIRQRLLTFLPSRPGRNFGSHYMIVKRGKNAYQYQSSCVNGEVKTVSQGTVSTQELHEHEKRKEETHQHRQRVQDLAQLQPSVNQALPFAGTIGAHCFSDD